MVARAVDHEDRRRVRVVTRGAATAVRLCRDPEVLLDGPAGTGKTVGALWKVHACLLKYAGAKAIVTRKFGNTLAASTMQTYKGHVLRVGNWGISYYGGSRVEPPGYRYPNGSFMGVAGMDDPAKIMSTEWDMAYVNEALDLELGDWEDIGSRLRNFVMPYQQLIGDTNPGPPSHWLNLRCIAGLVTRLWSRHEDNPRYFRADGTMTPEGTEYIARLDRLSGVRYQRRRLGNWVAAEGLVYPGFDQSTMVRVVDCDGWDTVLGVDVGTNNPTAILTVRVAGDERQHIEREVYRAGMTASEIVAAIVAEWERTRARAIFIDPSAAGYVLDLIALGLPVEKADNDRKRGMALCQDAIAVGLTVDSSCVNVVREILTYHYPEGKETDDPVKAGDHAMDAWRYATVGLAAPQEEEGVVIYDEPVAISPV